MYKKCFYFLSVLCLIGFKVSAAEKLLTTLKKSSLAPDFQLIDMDDKKHRLSDYRGKPVIINFWATWCPPCREELPSMNRAWKKIKQDGIIMLAVNVGEDDDTIFSFLGSYPIDFTVLLDQSGEVTEQWPIKGLPTTFVINPQGYIVYRAIGGRAWDDDNLLDKVRELRKQIQK
jgi:peroxiredoxin